MTDVLDTEETVLRNEVVITLGGNDTVIPMASLDDITIDSTDTEILGAVRGIVQEQRDVDITDENNDYSFAVRKAMNSNTIYIYPKPVAG